MKKEILITLLCAGLMLLTPFTTIAHENKVSSNLTDNPDINGLIVQIRTVVNEILQKYGHIPMVSNLCNVILNALDLFGNILICIILILLLIPCFLLIAVSYYTGMGILLYNVFWIIIVIGMTMEDYCLPYNSLISILPLKSIYTLTETNVITELVRDCPCLQE